MNRPTFAMLATLACAWAVFLAFSQPADVHMVDGLANVSSALSAAHVSDDAMALANLALLVCSNSGACGR